MTCGWLHVTVNIHAMDAVLSSPNLHTHMHIQYMHTYFLTDPHKRIHVQWTQLCIYSACKGTCITRHSPHFVSISIVVCMCAFVYVCISHNIYMCVFQHMYVCSLQGDVYHTALPTLRKYKLCSLHVCAFVHVCMCVCIPHLFFVCVSAHVYIQPARERVSHDTSHISSV
jgi:hypothetical protein